MTGSTEIYLGKNGETFGPYTADQFLAMRGTPGFGSYTYVWDGREANPDWKPLEKAPAPPCPPAHAKPGPLPPAPATGRLGALDAPGLEALCVDARSAIPGRITQATDAGCELVCALKAAVPGFGSRSPVLLNLLDPLTGKSMNVPARLGGIRREHDCWRLRVLWKGCPQLVLQQLEKSA